MANRILFLILLVISFNFVFANENIPTIELNDYEKIYSELKEADFNYIFGLDPYQNDDYTKYMYSPYPLFRSGVTLVFKSIKIPPGYYLLTPREQDGKTWILFKENGKVICTIPIYKEEIVPEGFYEDKLPSKKLSFTQKMGKKTMEFIGKKWGKTNKRTPIPKAYIEFRDKGNFWDMILYYDSKKYYLLFKKD